MFNPAVTRQSLRVRCWLLDVSHKNSVPFSPGRHLQVMPELDDIALLAQYARDNSEAAFATLVTRHVNLVYSTRCASAGNPNAAEEITQAVFIILARKARVCPREPFFRLAVSNRAADAANFLRAKSARQTPNRRLTCNRS